MRISKLIQPQGQKHPLENATLPDSYASEISLSKLSNNASAASSLQDQKNWVNLTDGLGKVAGLSNPVIDDMAMSNGYLYALVDDPKAQQDVKTAIYRLDGEGWQYFAGFAGEDDFGYGAKALLAGDSNTLYVLGHTDVHSLDLSTGSLLNITALTKDKPELEFGGSKAVFKNGKLYAIATGETSSSNASGKSVAIYDTQDGKWSYIPINHSIDQKPHIELLVDNAEYLV